MSINLKGRSLLTVKDYTAKELRFLIDLAQELKAKKKLGQRDELLKGKNIVLLFEKTSTRTRCAFEVAAFDEGANVTFLSNSQIGEKESIEDTAKVLGRMYEGIEFRGYKQETVEQLAEFSGVPVWNGLTDLYHPTQVLADIMTMIENTKKSLSELKLTFVGDARNNVANSLMIGCAKLGMHFCAIAPKALFPQEALVDEMLQECKISGGQITLSEDIADVKESDAIYTDVWVSMGEGDKYKERIDLLHEYQVNMDMINKAQNSDVIFLHCLPAFHDTNTAIGLKVSEKYGLSEMEVTDEVFRSHYSKVFDQAENRLHTIKAVMVATLLD